MKVLFVSDAPNVHTERWVKALKNKGIDLFLYTFFPPADDFYLKIGIKHRFYNLFNYKGKGFLAPILKIIMHIRATRDLKKFIKAYRPDILHAHYATSNGIICALSGFHPFLISVWGSDVYDFPRQSPLKLRAFKYILKKADRILSTSHIMAREIAKYTSKPVDVTPFGVDIDKFKPEEKHNNDGKFKIGIVKSLKALYGIDYLIRAFKKFCDKVQDKNAVLEIVGEGGDKYKLNKLAEDLGISEQVIFRGFVDNDLLPDVYNSFDVCVFLSLMESFGVAVVEAMACGCPVVTSDADGFMEIVENGISGLIVPRKDADSAAEAIFKLYSDKELRHRLSVYGRKRVEQLYDWNENVDAMISIYNSVLCNNNGE